MLLRAGMGTCLHGQLSSNVSRRRILPRVAAARPKCKALRHPGRASHVNQAHTSRQRMHSPDRTRRPSVRRQPARHRGARLRIRPVAPQRAATIAAAKEQRGTLSERACSLRHRRAKRQVNCEYKTATCHAFSANKVLLGSAKPLFTRVHPLAFGPQSVHGHAHAANTKSAG